MKRRIKVLYTGPLDGDLDEKITRALEAIGCKWYAQGMDMQTRERDICFDYEGLSPMSPPEPDEY